MSLMRELIRERLTAPALARGGMVRVGGMWKGSSASPGHQTPAGVRAHTSTPSVATSGVYPGRRVMRTACQMCMIQPQDFLSGTVWNLRI